MANSTSAAGADTGTPTRNYCSESNGAESMLGTAATVDVWLCLEYRTTWKAKALADNALAASTGDWLAETLDALAAAGLKARPQFIRQPGADREDTRLLVAANGRTFQFSGRGYDFLRDLDLAGQIDRPEAMAANGEEINAPQYLVCTNGQRDLCCARFGLPVYNLLTERVGKRAWQVTHLGGHRFAPNVLTLPDACLYGRVHADGVDEFLSLTESGAVDFTRLRGRTCYPPVVQAGEACIGRQGMRLLHVDGDEDRASIQFADDASRVTVTVGRSEQPAQVTKSCGDSEPTEVFPFIQR